MFSLLHSLYNDLDPSAVSALLSEFTLKSTLLTGLGLALSAALVKCPAALRFRILWLTVMAVPVFLIASFVSVSRNSAPGLTLTIPDLAASDAGSSPEGAAVSVTGGNLLGEAPISSGHPAGPAWHQDSVLLLTLVWLVGVGIAVTRMGLHRWRLWRRTTCCWSRITQGPLHESMSEVARTAGLKSNPRLFLSQEWIMPATWGWRRPSLVLPAEAGEWTATRLGHVLQHECGHMARRDALTHLLASLALALVWFLPPAWLARRQLAVLREAACDDWVLTRGAADPLAYGGDLLALVKHQLRQAKRPTPAAAMGIGMAKSSSVGKRIQRLMAEGVNRSQPTRRARRGIFAGWAGLVGATSLLVSCRTADNGVDTLMSSARFNTPPASHRQEISRFPQKPRAGADSIHFGIIEITMREDSPNFLSPWLPVKNTQGLTREPLAFESLRLLSQTKGVDLLSVPPTAEGQELRFSMLGDFRYPIEFDGKAQPLAFDTREVGLRLVITGEKSRDGKVITADVDLKVTDYRGDQTYKNAGSKPIGYSPRFNTRSQSQKGLKIPNGGFTLLPFAGLGDTGEMEMGPATSGPHSWRKSTRPVTRYLGISAVSPPLPSAAAGVNPPKPVIFP